MQHFIAFTELFIIFAALIYQISEKYDCIKKNHN